MPEANRVEFDAPIEKVRRLRQLQKLKAQREQETIAEKRRQLLIDYPHPLALAMYLDPNVVTTPAMDYISKSLVSTFDQYNGRLTVSMSSQLGKAVDVNEPVLTTEGWSTMKDLRPGDEVFHPDGHPVQVVETHPVRHDRPCYRVSTTDGRSVVVDEEHLWTVQDRRRENKSRGQEATWETLTTVDLLRRGLLKDQWTRPNGRTGRAFAFRLPRQHGIVSKPAELPIDPYVLGAWLGDGTTVSAGFTCADPEIVEHIRAAGLTVERREGTQYGWYISRQDAHREAKARARALVEQEGIPGREAKRRVGLPVGSDWGGLPSPRRAAVDARPCVLCGKIARHGGRGLCRACYQRCRKDGTLPSYIALGPNEGHLRKPESYAPRLQSFQADLRDVGVLRNKHIPDAYLTAGTEQRLALLQGLMDTDGSIHHGTSSSTCTFAVCNKSLAEGTLYLVRSLGWRATLNEAAAKLNGREVGRQWKVTFTPQQGEPVPFRLMRKVERIQPPQSRGGERHAVSIVSVERVESRPVRCIKVNSDDGLFLVGRDLIPTHNTFLTRWAIFFALMKNPDQRAVFASFSMELARTSGRILRGYIEQHGEPYGLRLDRSHHDATDWQLEGFEGGLLAASIESTLTGRPSDLMVLDDLHSGEADANSPTIRNKVEVWWQSTARMRMAPGTSAVAIGTRFSYQDILSKFIAEGWNRINIPAVSDGVTLDSVADVPGARTEDGYLITTRGTTPDDWRQLRREIGERAFNSLSMGNPVPLEGSVYKTAWFETHRRAELDDSDRSLTAIFVDPAETGTGDEAGILVAARTRDAQVAVLADYTAQLSAAQWGRKVCLAWMEWNAARVVQERTLGLASTIPDAWAILTRQATALASHASIRSVEKRVRAAFDELVAAGDRVAADLDQLHEIVDVVEVIPEFGTRGPRVVTVNQKVSKRARAEAVASAWETGRAFMVGAHPELEWEAVTWGGPGSKAKSPNRLDTMAMATAYLEVAGGRASITRRPASLQLIPTATVRPMAR